MSRQAQAHAALEDWFREAPGGQWLPDDFMDREPCTLVTVRGDGDDNYFFTLFVDAYQADAGDDEGERVYTVPLIVAQALVWYGGEEAGWWAEIAERENLTEPVDPMAPPTYFEMYTPEADAAVHAFLIEAKRLADDDPEIRNKQTLAEKLRPLHRKLAEQHPEVGDTEPRNHIADYLDLLCEAHGWVFNRHEGYW